MNSIPNEQADPNAQPADMNKVLSGLAAGGAPTSEPDQWLDASFTLRNELKFDARSQGKTAFVVIEDPVRSKFFQIGSMEYSFIAAMDGVKTGRDLVAELNQNKSTESPVTDDSARAIVQWLIQNNLAYGNTMDNAKRLNQQASSLNRQKLMGLLNPISCKVTLFNPNKALKKIQPYMNWLFSTWFLIVWCAVGLYTLTQIYAHWDKMGSASTGILSGYSWVWLLLTWLLLKIIHEAAHGTACRRYGGEVPEAGVLFLLFTPMAFVNVTSMWRFANRWHRIVVAAAGMYIELFISFLSFIVWTRADGVVADVAFNVFLMSSVTTILFNANPLMRFDGYFLLSDILGIPNLYPKGTKWFGDRLKSLFFGLPKTANICSDKELRRVAIYGCMAFFWKISISVSLIIGAGVLFHGAGLVLSAFGVGLWFGLPIYKQFVSIFGSKAQHPIRPVRVLASFAMVALVGGSLFSVLKAPATKSAPAIVQFADETLLRADANGFISELLVNSGDAVKKGDVLIRLDNPKLANEVVEIERLANEALIQSRIYKKQKELSLSLAELEKHEELKEQLEEKRQEAGGLNLVAPFDGFVFQRNLENQLGSFAKRGDPLLTIAQQQTKEVVVSIDQRDLESIKGNEGNYLRVAIPGATLFKSKMIRVNPRASTTPTHPSLCAQAGGPLTVRPAAGKEDSDEAAVELLTPRFNVVLELESELSSSLRSGQRGRAFFSTCQQSLGSYFYLAAADWLENKIEIATQTAVF
ncbi:MAG: HlyD family efflux transporter periplasmic adaptor subunit [Mariniblastus sp.]